jgi:hypothetical protein
MSELAPAPRAENFHCRLPTGVFAFYVDVLWAAAFHCMPVALRGQLLLPFRQVTTPNLTEGVAAAQEASILVGMHGANMANSWFMRPGSSTVEIMPFGWVASQPGAMSLSGFNAGVSMLGCCLRCRHLGAACMLRLWLATCCEAQNIKCTCLVFFVSGIQHRCWLCVQDPTSQLLWWVLNICDPSLSSPGPEEQQKIGSKKWWPRDRSARLPWAALEVLLAQIVDADGKFQSYLQEWYRPGKYVQDVGSSGILGQSRRQL